MSTIAPAKMLLFLINNYVLFHARVFFFFPNCTYLIYSTLLNAVIQYTFLWYCDDKHIVRSTSLHSPFINIWNFIDLWWKKKPLLRLLTPPNIPTFSSPSQEFLAMSGSSSAVREHKLKNSSALQELFLRTKLWSDALLLNYSWPQRKGQDVNNNSTAYW